MAVQEMAWAGNKPKVKILKPRIKQVLEHGALLIRAFDVLDDWYGGTTSFNSKRFEEAIKPIIYFFGFDPYTGPLFRAIPLLKNLSSKNLHEGDLKRLAPAKTGQALSSWTTSLSQAVAYGQKNYGYSKQGYAIIQLQDKGMQVMNSVFLFNVVGYLLNIIKDTTIRSLYKKIDRLSAKPKLSAKAQARLDTYVKLAPLLKDLKSAANALQHSLHKFKREDEIITRLPKRAKVQIKLLNREIVTRRRPT